jgi:WD40 repeat protein
LRASAGTRLFRTPFVRDTLVSSVAASRSNQVVFAGCADFSAVIWKLETGAVVLEATEHTAECLALFDAADGAGWVTTAGTVWRLNRRGALERIAATGASWAEAVFSSEGVLARRLDGGVDSVSWKGEVEHLYQPPEPVVGHWSSRAETLIRRRDRVVFPMTGKKVVVQVGTRHVQVERSAQLVRAKLHPDGGRLALQGWTEEIELWFLHDRGAAHLRAFPCPGGVGDFDFSEDGTRLATGTIGNGGGHYDRDVLVYDVESGQLLRRLRHHQWQLKRVRFAPDGRSLATLADEVCLWQLNRDAPPVCIGVEGGRTEADLEFLSDGRLLIVDRQRIRVFREASLIASFPAPIAFRTKWCVSPDARSVLVAIEGGFVRFELESGRELESIRVDCPRPDALPPPDLARDLKARGGVGLWRTAFGQFLHQSDGPRGWVQPVRLFPSGDVAIPTQAGVAVLHVGDVVSPRGVVPFSGKLRASWIRDGRVVLVNHEGRIFASSLGATG